MPPRKRIDDAPVAAISSAQYDYDLDAALVEEENSEPFRFKWGGEVYSLPLLAALPADEQIEFENQPVVDQMIRLLGADAYERLTTEPGADGRKLSMGRLRDLVDAWLAHQGLERGKSPASSDSSANTARRSRPTSRSGRRR